MVMFPALESVPPSITTFDSAPTERVDALTVSPGPMFKMLPSGPPPWMFKALLTLSVPVFSVRKVPPLLIDPTDKLPPSIVNGLLNAALLLTTRFRPGSNVGVGLLPRSELSVAKSNGTLPVY